MTMRGKALTDEELEFVRLSFPQLNITEIAERLGRSRQCVSRAVGSLGLRGKRQQIRKKNGRPDSPEPTGSESAARLEELRDLLRAALLDAGPANMASLAREYRATIDLLERMEGGADDDASAALDAVARSIASRMSP